MERYDYYRTVKEDAINYIIESLEWNEITAEELDEEKEQEILDNAFVSDSVTGNASGSYTFNRWQAEENICHNMDLALEAYQTFGYEGITDDEAERIDVTIRCYVLYEVWSDALEEVRNTQIILPC